MANTRDWVSQSDYHNDDYAEAHRRIDIARRTAAEELSFADLPTLSRLPPLSGLQHLLKLDLSDCPVSDGWPLTNLPNLQQLDIARTKISDLSAISELALLRMLNLSSTRVIDLAPLSNLNRLQQLNFSSTQVATISPLRRLTKIQYLSFNKTQVVDLSPLSSLTQLKFLSIAEAGLFDIYQLETLGALESLNLNFNADIHDLRPLSKMLELQELRCNVTGINDLAWIKNLTKLRLLGLSGTYISDLSPLAGMRSLEELTLVNCKSVSNLSALTGLISLRSLHISASLVSDLSPISNLIHLIDGARANPRSAGISFQDCPLTDSHLIKLSSISNPQRTVETLAHLRQQQGLPEIIDDADTSEEQKEDWQRALQSLHQDQFGAQFDVLDTHLVIASSGQATDLTAVADKTTRQLHAQVKIKASELSRSAVRLSNDLYWQSFSKASDRFDRIVQAELEVVAEHVGEVWAELVSLGSFLEQDDSLQGSHDPEPLAPDVRRALVDVIQTAGPWIRRFPTARRLDDEHASFQAPQDCIPDAQQVLTAVIDRRILRGGDADLLVAALASGDHAGFQSGKARTWGFRSARNVVFSVVTVVGLGFAFLSKGYFGEIGKQVADKSILAQAGKDLLLSKEKELLQLVKDLPADIRAAIRTLIDRLKKP